MKNSGKVRDVRSLALHLVLVKSSLKNHNQNAFYNILSNIYQCMKVL